jgi:hypothetical protein
MMRLGGEVFRGAWGWFVFLKKPPLFASSSRSSLAPIYNTRSNDGRLFCYRFVMEFFKACVFIAAVCSRFTLAMHRKKGGRSFKCIWHTDK